MKKLLLLFILTPIISVAQVDTDAYKIKSPYSTEKKNTEVKQEATILSKVELPKQSKLIYSMFMSIETPEGYDSAESNDPKQLFMLVKSMGDKGYVNFSIDYIDDDVFSLIKNDIFIDNAISEKSVSDWITLGEDLESYKHRQSVKYTFNSIGATLMRQDSFIQDDETVLFTFFQFVYDGKLFTCSGKSINTDKEYFDDYVEIMESIKLK